MFEDILGEQPIKPTITGKLEKNGELVENALVDVTNYERELTGYITCPDLEVTDEDFFCLFLYSSEGERIYTRSMQIFVEKEKDEDGRFKFVIARTP